MRRRRIPISRISLGLAACVVAVTVALPVPAASADTPDSTCTLSLPGLSTPTNGDNLAYGGFGIAAAYGDGVTNALLNCTGLSADSASGFAYLFQQDGGWEVLSVYDSDFQYGPGPTYTPLPDPLTIDLNTAPLSTDDTTPTELAYFTVDWYGSLANADAGFFGAPWTEGGDYYVFDTGTFYYSAGPPPTVSSDFPVPLVASGFLTFGLGLICGFAIMTAVTIL